MDDWAWSLAHFARSQAFAMELKDHAYMGVSSRFLISPFNESELRFLASLKIPSKHITIVSPASDLLEWEHECQNARLVADDLLGAVREHPRKFVAARLDANALDEAFVERARVVIAHGMADRSILTLVFPLGEDSPRSGCGAEGCTQWIQWTLNARLGARVAWYPTHMIIAGEEGSERTIVQGLVRRGATKYSVACQCRATGSDRAELQTSVYDYAQTCIQGRPGESMGRVINAVRAVFCLSSNTLSDQELQQWATSLPPTTTRSRQSALSSSASTPKMSTTRLSRR